MAFDPELWLQVSEVCCISIPDVDHEALLRTAVNRAYYSALLCIRVRIEHANGAGTISNRRTHEAIFQAIRVADGPAFVRIFQWLRELRQAREVVDYELGSAPLHRETAHRLVELSRMLIRNYIKPLPDAEFRRLKVPRV